MRLSARVLHGLLAAGLLTMLGVAAHGRLVGAAHETVTGQLRESRIALQRAETERAVLRHGRDRLASLDLPLPALELALIEAITTLADLSGVAELQYELRSGPAARRVELETALDVESATATPITRVHIVLSFRGAHGDATLEALQTLRAAVEFRPLHVDGCRVLRAGNSLSVSCALDWFWWSTA